MVCNSLREAKIDTVSLTDSEKEEIILAAEQSALPVAGTQSGQQYLIKYDETVPSSSKPTKEPIN